MQGILAPLQFLVFLVSLALVIRTLMTGEGATAATVSVVIKTMVLYAIMVTGTHTHTHTHTRTQKITYTK